MMKKSIKIVAIFQAFILFYFSLTLYNSDLLIVNAAYSNENPSSDKNLFSILPCNLYYSSTNSEEISNGLNKLLPSDRYNQHILFALKNKVAELFYENSYADYFYHTISFIFNLEPPDIIFPFNYFW